MSVGHKNNGSDNRQDLIFPINIKRLQMAHSSYPHSFDMSSLKVLDENIEVEYGVSIYSIDRRSQSGSVYEEIQAGLAYIEEELQVTQDQIEILDKNIEHFTNRADQIDNMVAVGSGVLAGMIDVLWVGEFSLDRGTEWGRDKVNKFVENVAKWTGYTPKEGASADDRLRGAIVHLEKKYGAPSDSNTPEFGGGKQHHLRDFAHHPTPVGLVFSILTQFTCKSYGTDTAGAFIVVDVKNYDLIGKDIAQKFLFGVVYWCFHLISDMAGSSNNAGAGTGIPGPILSLFKELSSLPIFKDKDGVNWLSKNISKLFNGTLLADRDENGNILADGVRRFDLRAEIGVAYELSRQALPVLVNECIVRGFYFIRRLFTEVAEKPSFREIEWGKTLPWSNRTVRRMLTISTGTFTAIDLADAAIRAALKSGGTPAGFGAQFVLRVNFVGLGRFAIAFYSDLSMGYRRNRFRDERIDILSQQLHLANAKVFYLQGGAWQAAVNTAHSLQEAERMVSQSARIFVESWEENRLAMRRIGMMQAGIDSNNPRLIEDIKKILKWI